MSLFSSNDLTSASESIKQREEQAPPPANEDTGRSTSSVAVGAMASGDDIADVSDVPSEEEKKDADVDTDMDRQVEGPVPLTLEEQQKLAKDVNELFKVIFFSRYGIAIA